jgi:nucleoid-associated protein YgaU
MGRDKVLGLSLAILVIGIAAAFCFRNEPIVESGLKLARANILDEAISKLPGPKPYPQEAKPEKRKPTLPTVTLKGIESVDPFADRQASASAEREKTATPIDKPKQSPPVKLAAADSRTAAPEQMPAIDTRAASDAAMASIDTDKAAPEINTSTPSTAPAFPAEKPSIDPSTLLTSTAPPITDQPNGQNDASVGEIVIRPNAPSSGHTRKVKDQNVSWQSKAARENRDKIAENSPRIEPTTNDSSGDDPHRNECTRDNPTRDVPGLAPPKNENSDDNSVRDTPVAIDSERSDRTAVNPNGDPTSHEVDSSSKAIVHRVRRGDMLTKIALHYLGDSRRYREIYEANRDQLRTPNDRLKIGMMLRIPANTAQPAPHESAVAKRKSRSGRMSRNIVGTTGASKVPIHNAARMREKPQSDPAEQPAASSSDDQGMHTDRSSTNRFVPVRRAPFLPGTKSQSDQPSPSQKPETMDPATSSRDVPRRDPIRLAGDREDATIR